MSPGRYCLIHTAEDAQIPAVTGGASRGVSGPLIELTTLWVPCGRHRYGPGDVVGVTGPFGTGWRTGATTGRPWLVIAWEAGLSLVRPVIEEALGDPGPRPRIRVWAGGRTLRAIPFRDRWDEWAARGAEVTTSASWTLTMAAAAAEVGCGPGTGAALLAGPLSMQRATAKALVRRGVPAERIQLSAHPLIRCGTGRCGRCRIVTGDRALFACRNGPILTFDLFNARGTPEAAKGGRLGASPLDAGASRPSHPRTT